MFSLRAVILLFFFMGFSSSFFLKITQDNLHDLKYPKHNVFESWLLEPPSDTPDDLKNLRYPDDSLMASWMSKLIGAFSGLLVS